MNIFNKKQFDNFIYLIEKLYYVILIAILIVASFNIFYNLGKVPINSWDEARHGVSAYEMIKRNEYIVNTYAYKNDYWNLKPPISYWTIILGYKIAGFTPLGLRIFWGFTAILTTLTIAAYSLYTYGRLASLISTAVLSTTIPFITEHCARSGDADSIYVLFFTTAIICLSLIEKSNKWIYGFGLSFALAFLTKSWHAGNIVVIGIAYLLLSKVLFKLKAKQISIFILSSSIPIFIWGILRYTKDGITFLKIMIGQDLMVRTSRAIEGHVGGVYYYFENLQWSYFYWSLVFVGTALACIVLLYRYISDRELINQMLAIALWIAVPLSLYTAAKTKISWYILPIYPAIAVSIGAASNFLLKEKNRNLITLILLSTMITAAIYKNEAIIIKRISSPTIDSAQELIKQIEKLPEYHGKRIYIHHFEQSYWLSAELYADLTPVEGGVESFLKDHSDKTLLFITKDKASGLGKERDGLKIVLENKVAFILTKQ